MKSHGILLLIYLIINQNPTNSVRVQIKKNRNERGIIVALAIGALIGAILTPIIIGSVIVGYAISYKVRDTNGGRMKI